MSNHALLYRMTALAQSRMNLPSALFKLVEIADLWRQRRRSRNALLRLEPHLLKDIGLDRQACEIEGRRPAWHR